MSKSTRANIIWGASLILVGAFLLLANIDVIPDLSGNFWVIAFGLVGLLFLVGYLASGVRNWWFAFPAAGSLAVALTIYLAEAGTRGELVGGLFMIMASSPFWIAFLVGGRQNWWALIPAWSAAALGAVILLSTSLRGEAIGAIIMFSIALPFMAVYLVNRQHWWALIPAYTMTTIGLIIILSMTVRGEYIGAFVMFAIAFPFLVVFLVNRANWWALIPAGIMGAIGTIVFLVGLSNDESVGGLILFIIALPFFILFFNRRENWWALIPAGVLTSAGITALLATSGSLGATEERLLSGVMFGGLALTFGALWLLRRGPQTDWAKYPAGVLLVVALLVGLFGADSELVWPIGLVAFGVWLLWRGRRPEQLVEKSPGEVIEPDPAAMEESLKKGA